MAHINELSIFSMGSWGPVNAAVRIKFAVQRIRQRKAQLNTGTSEVRTRSNIETLSVYVALTRKEIHQVAAACCVLYFEV